MTGIILLFCVGCKEEERFFYFDKDAPAPAMVDKEAITVYDFAGYSVIRFLAPDDNNLMCIRAEYESSPGVVREVKASRYTDTLAIEGFGVAGDYAVKLYSVGKNSKESNPVEITVSPLTPPIIEAFPSLDLVQTFGGVQGSFYNAHGSYLTAILMADTAQTGNPEWLQSFVIKDRNARFAFLGLDSITTDFSVYLKDRWGNKSDTKYFTLKPLFEKEIEKSKWRRYALPSDYYNPLENNESRYRFENAWDGITETQWGDVFCTTVGPYPMIFTIDLGQTVSISRFKFWHWRGYEFTGAHNLKVFECWGSNVQLPGDDLFGGDWTLLAICRSHKPSGDDNLTVTAEDRAYGREGENHFFRVTDEIPNPHIPIRYFRIRVLENWFGAIPGATGQTVIPEMTLYGQTF